MKSDVLGHAIRVLTDGWGAVPLDRHEQIAHGLREALAGAPGVRRTLAETGLVYVSLRALEDMREQYPEMGEEEARRLLTGVAAGAKRVDDTGDGVERWRSRRAGGLDVTLQVARDGELAVVTSIGQVRQAGRTSRKRDGKSRRRG